MREKKQCVIVPTPFAASSNELSQLVALFNLSSPCSSPRAEPCLTMTVRLTSFLTVLSWYSPFVDNSAAQGNEMKIQKVFEAFEQFHLGEETLAQLFTQLEASLLQVNSHHNHNQNLSPWSESKESRCCGNDEEKWAFSHSFPPKGSLKGRVLQNNYSFMGPVGNWSNRWNWLLGPKNVGRFLGSNNQFHLFAQRDPWRNNCIAILALQEIPWEGSYVKMLTSLHTFS